MKYAYIVVEMEGGVLGLNDLELAKAIAEHEPVIDVSTGTWLLTASGFYPTEIESWATSFPSATVKDPWDARPKETKQLPASGTIDAGDESFPRD